MTRQYLKAEGQQRRSYSKAVVTSGGEKTIYLAGVGGMWDTDGTLIAGNVRRQGERTFELIEENLIELGGTLADIVSMVVYVLDMRFDDEFCEVRKQYFGDDFPSSSLLGVSAFAESEMLIEITATAVFGDR
jgi:2-iminobutanoate/2-iminopropanoate deaminase